MATSKDMYNNSPRPKDTMSDSSSCNDFDPYGFNFQALLVMVAS